MVIYPYHFPDIPEVCLPLGKRNMSAAGQDHVVVELVGGPLDGRRFTETTEMKISHNPSHVYSFNGSIYRPWKIESGGVLKMRYDGRDTEKAAPASVKHRVTRLRVVE